jgi:hypothetical protein
MNKNTPLTRALTLTGTVLVLLPVALPVLFAGIFLLFRGRFLLDFLMPAELFFSVLGGAVLLFLAAVRVRQDYKRIGWLTAGGIAALGVSLAVAQLTGLDDAGMDEKGGIKILVIGMIIVYDLAVAAVGVMGIILLRKLFRDSRTVPAEEDETAEESVGEDQPEDVTEDQIEEDDERT